MNRTPIVLLLIIIATIFELSIAPYISIADATISFTALVVAGLFILGFLDLALQAAITGGVLLDLASGGPFGTHTVTLGVLWGLFFLVSKHRLVAPRAVVVSVVMATTGMIVTVYDMLLAPSFLLILAGALLNSMAGTALFPVLRRIISSQDTVKL